jgi:hypothetical protein
MRTLLPKTLLLFAIIASVFIFFACSSRQGSVFEPEPASSSSSDPSPGNDLDPSSSSAIVSSSSAGTVGLSSSATVSSSSSIRSSSSARSSSSIGSSSSVRSSSSVTATTTSSSSATTVPVVPLCTRAGLESAVNSYLAAIAAGDYTKMPLTSDAKYYENDHDAKQNYSTGKYDKAVPFGDGLWKTPLKVDFHRNLIDVDSCATYTEIIIANSEPQYVLGTRLDVKDDKISKVTLVVTQKGDWGFNAPNYLRYSKGEDWSELPATGRRTREQLRVDSYAYLAYFDDSTKVDPKPPWAKPCARLEGGAYTGDGGCNVGIPQKTPLKPVSYLADVDYGMVVVFLYFGGADSHWFRILPAGYRYIHTLTAMKQSDYQAPR